MVPFIDWNGNGKIDPTDIAICIALDEENSDLEDDESAPMPDTKRKSKQGCLTSVAAFIFGITLIAIFLMR